MNLFRAFAIFLVGALIFSCGQKGHHEHHAVEGDGTNPNQALYDQVMDIHDEVMPETETLYNLSKSLKVQLSEAVGDEEQIRLQERIAYLDSVNDMMMDWMRKFKPQPDTVDPEKARAYYELELEKIKRVKEAMLTAIEKEGVKK